jgi:hypothetical protein
MRGHAHLMAKQEEREKKREKKQKRACERYGASDQLNPSHPEFRVKRAEC